MNFLQASVVAADARQASVALAIGPTLDLPVAGRVEPGAPVTVGIRPEHILLAGDGAGAYAAPATLVEMLGSDTFVHLGAGDETIIVRDSSGRRLRSGAPVSIDLPPEACHLFDAAGRHVSGRRQPAVDGRGKV